MHHELSASPHDPILRNSPIPGGKRSLLDVVANPDIAALSKEHGGVAEYFVDGQYQFDVLEASYQLADALLKKHFGLNVTLPREHLCPRVANRLDYIIWMKQIVETTCSGEVLGMDIGVGATCIYPLLGCSVTDWSFIGTDINDQSLEYCRQNVAQNNLQHRIKIFKAGTTIFDLDSVGVDDLDFTMCNPPFYDTAQEMENSKRAKVLNPTTVKLVAQDDELFTTGGEEALTNQMIHESMRFQGKIRWYSTMVGKKTTLERIVATLRENGINNYGIHEIVHGNGKTRRWTIAWSFLNNRLSDSIARTNSHAIRHLNPSPNEFPVAIDFVKLLPVLNELQTSTTGLQVTQLDPTIFVECNGNVWSRSYRRKVARGEEAPADPQDRYEFEILNDTIRWVYGRDPVVYESFCSMVQQRCR